MSGPPAEENRPNYISTDIETRALDGRVAKVVVPLDVSPAEAACFAVFLAEWSARHLSTGRWNFEVRLKHYGLERFLLEDGRG